MGHKEIMIAASVVS